MPILRVRDFKKVYGPVQALRGVSFELEPGEIFGYLGPNGAGKTTTLRMILGLVRPTSGRAELFGRDASEAVLRRRIGYLPGELRLYGSMSCSAVLDYYARYRPGRPTPLRAQLIDAFDLERAALSQKVKFLSHGTRQKLGLIVAMQHDPELLLLDEPTTGLDPLVQRSLRDVLRDLALRGRAVFFSSHVLSEVEALCNRVAILRSGELVALESVENLRSKMIRRIRARFRGPMPEDLASVPGVTTVRTSGNEAEIWIRGDVNPIIRRLASGDLDHFAFPEPDLEDIFLSYYRGAAGG